MDGQTDGQTDGWMDGRTDGRTDGRMEILPILQDFVPYRGRCPTTAPLQPENSLKQGKGTADHVMPLGEWLNVVFKGYLCMFALVNVQKGGLKPGGF